MGSSEPSPPEEFKPSKLVAKKDHFKGRSALDFFSFIRSNVSALDQTSYEKELEEILLPEEMGGLALRIKASLGRLPTE